MSILGDIGKFVILAICEKKIRSKCAGANDTVSVAGVAVQFIISHWMCWELQTIMQPWASRNPTTTNRNPMWLHTSDILQQTHVYTACASCAV